MENTSYLFVDGAYFRQVVDSISRRHFNGDIIEIAPRSLTRNYRKTFYYDCPPPKRQGESDADHEARISTQREFTRALLKTEGVHVFEGTTLREGKRARQKQIDVAIAVDMLSHAHRRNMNWAFLLAGDLDFKPLIDALVRDGMYVTLWYERRSASKELALAADSRMDLCAREIYNLASDDFRRGHALPDVGGIEITSEPTTPIESGALPDGGEARLFKNGLEFMLTVPDPHFSQQRITYRFGDQDRLKLFVEDYVGDFSWTVRPTA